MPPARYIAHSEPICCNFQIKQRAKRVASAITTQKRSTAAQQLSMASGGDPGMGAIHAPNMTNNNCHCHIHRSIDPSRQRTRESANAHAQQQTHRSADRASDRLTTERRKMTNMGIPIRFLCSVFFASFISLCCALSEGYNLFC